MRQAHLRHAWPPLAFHVAVDKACGIHKKEEPSYQHLARELWHKSRAYLARASHAARPRICTEGPGDSPRYLTFTDAMMEG